MREALSFLHDAWINYVGDWFRSGPVYFAGVNITKVGTWPTCVVRVASTR